MPSSVQMESVNEQTFIKLYTNHKSVLHKQALVITGSELNAQEIVQEVFLRVWIHREKIGEIKDINAYLFKIAKNLFYDQFCRREKLRSITDQILSSDNKNTIEELIDERELQRKLQLAIQSLSEQRRKIFVLGKIERWPREKIASVLGISEFTVKVTMQTAIRDVGKFLGPEYGKMPKKWHKKVKSALMEIKILHAA